jgi:hypothetical protein
MTRPPQQNAPSLLRLRENASVFEFSYGCPAPVLVKRCILVYNGIAKRRVLTCGCVRGALAIVFDQLRNTHLPF